MYNKDVMGCEIEGQELDDWQRPGQELKWSVREEEESRKERGDGRFIYATSSQWSTVSRRR
jgi:hypothetical protein